MAHCKWICLGGLVAAALVFSLIASDSLAISADCKARPRPDSRETTNYFRNEFTPRFKREACIVKTRVTYGDGVNQAMIEKQLRREFSSWLYINEPKAAAYYWKQGRDAHYYLLYTDQCDRRFDITKRMVNEVATCFPGEAVLEVSTDVVKPGVDTIDIQSQEWID